MQNLSFFLGRTQVNNSSIVIFQKNVAEDFNKSAVAWKVINNCGTDDNHQFDYPMNFEVSVSDSYNNFTPKIAAVNGQVFNVNNNKAGDVLQVSSVLASNSNEVEIRNNLTSGAINANCYKEGKLIATKTGLTPGQKALFEFLPKIYIGTASKIDEGDVLNAAIISQITTEINLFGVTSADIIMTGGGSGKNATPFTFSLDNVNK